MIHHQLWSKERGNNEGSLDDDGGDNNNDDDDGDSDDDDDDDDDINDKITVDDRVKLKDILLFRNSSFTHWLDNVLSCPERTDYDDDGENGIRDDCGDNPGDYIGNYR